MFKILQNLIFLKYSKIIPETLTKNTTKTTFSYGKYVENNIGTTKEERIKAIQQFLESTR